MVGTVGSLWRYPVKSMLGETLQTVHVTPKGVLGDREYALWDVQTNRIASAKNPKKWAKLLDFQASFMQPPCPDQPTPPVQVQLPNGNAITSESPDIHSTLSTILEREVELLAQPPETPSLDHYWPNVPGTAYQDVTVQLFMPKGTFFDSCPIHCVTTATLTHLAQLYPEGQFDPRRFRPNLLIQSPGDAAGFVENDWVGGVLAIADVRLKIDTICPRCVVTTLAQSDLPQDLNILKTTATYNNVVAGIRLSVLQAGVIQQEDSIWLETA